MFSSWDTGSLYIQGTRSWILPGVLLRVDTGGSGHSSGPDRARGTMGGWLGCSEAPRRTLRQRSHPEEWVEI